MKFIEDNPDGITRADIVVGIPSYNEASSISYPTQQADKGLKKYYSDKSAVIINCDNHSPDNTRQAFMTTETTAPKIYISTEEGVTGKGNNVRNLLAKAVELSAQAVVLIDADLRSITPLWIRNLGEPLFEQYQFVAPLYVRHKYDGPITNSIAYPLTRALYGRRVRQPIGGDYGFSGELAKIFLETDAWSDSISSFGIDIWMTTTSVRNHVAVVQAFMGRPKVHKIKDILEDSDTLFSNVISTIFELMCKYETFWRDVKWSRPTAVFGFGVGDVEVPPPVNVDVRLLSQKFQSGTLEQWDKYKILLSPENIHKLEEVTELSPEGFEFPTGLWAKILFDFAVAYKNRVLGPEELISTLKPLFHGRILSFVLESQAMNTQQVEEYIEDQCLQFEKAKPYLLERWFA
ncbi:glycosyl transferase [Desulfomonile tiedjei]|uniref:Glycosyl transferase n=1 Tax=Desulfomonile tiedjei (strain ATCC 49306 / DSM 6799 / DCB-1) TaxID=706587 RepID=I4C0M0_DESTA|nr:glycosyl transferase [Desulfomonile tiedjei]AFM23111.1 glycosyl transferase [Desulfomonile tiedjei DSM 6799]